MKLANQVESAFRIPAGPSLTSHPILAALWKDLSPPDVVALVGLGLALLLVAFLFSRYRDRWARGRIVKWAQSHRLRVVRITRKWVLLSPFGGPKSDHDFFYRIKVRDEQGVMRAGWACVCVDESAFRGEVKVKWD